MRKSIMFTMFVTFALVFSVIAVTAKALTPSAYNGLNHSGKSSQLYLYEKDSIWGPVIGGAWGKMTFKSDSFVFNGHGLVAGEDYTLIHYPEPQTSWPHPVVVITSGKANEGGNVHLKGSMPTTLCKGEYCAKIWLVLSDDLESGSLSEWTPTEYLFEYDLI